MDFVGELLLGFIVRFLRDEGVAVRGCGTMFCRVVVPQRVTLPSLKFEQAVICPDGPSPATGEGNGGAEPSAASGGCSEAEHPQRSKKSSKRAARRFFRAPQGGGGKCARGYLGSVSVRSTDDALASFVSSTASDRKGLVKGESVPLDRVLVPFTRVKGTPRRRAVQIII